MPINTGKFVHHLPEDFQGSFGIGTSDTFGKTTLAEQGGVIQASGGASEQERFYAFYGTYTSQPINLASLDATGLTTLSLQSSSGGAKRGVVFTRTANASGGFSNRWDGASGDASMALVSTFDEPVNITPSMTANDAPAPYKASASTVYDANTHAPWRAFDQLLGGNNSWATAVGNNTGWVKFDWGVGNAKAATHYSVAAVGGVEDRAPKDWTLEGSNDDASWAVLDQVTGFTSWKGGDPIVFEITQNQGAYRFYRLNITANNGYPGLVQLGEFQLRILPGTYPSFGAGISAVQDLSISSSGSGSMKISGDATSNGSYVPIKIQSQTIALADALQIIAKCDNPDAYFRLKFHVPGSPTPLSPSASAHWSYEFKVDSSEFKDIFIPDYIRTNAVTTQSIYWLTLEVINPAGGFTLWLDEIRFRKGLRHGDAIQSPYRPWLQYRMVLMTNE